MIKSLFTICCETTIINNIRINPQNHAGGPDKVDQSKLAYKNLKIKIQHFPMDFTEYSFSICGINHGFCPIFPKLYPTSSIWFLIEIMIPRIRRYLSCIVNLIMIRIVLLILGFLKF